MEPGVRYRPLTEADVAEAAALSAVVGWNQDETDWRRLVDLHPEGTVAAWRGTERGGAERGGAERGGAERRSNERGDTERAGTKLVGTATLVHYGGQVAWLGMVIVAPEERGMGLGTALVDAALASSPLVEGGIVGLDATEYGARLYERRGFESVGWIDRWAGVLAPADTTAPAGLTVRRASLADLRTLAAFDRSAVGVDRSRLLEHLLNEASAVVVIAEAGSVLVGYGVLRTGRHHRHVGPLVATEVATQTAILNGLADHAAGAPVYLDALRMPGRGAQLERAGLSVVRRLQRMTRPATAVLSSEAVLAATAFEWG